MFQCAYAYFFFFFVKQKTAYEMRISDWSSDVCSSDLRAAADFACPIRCLGAGRIGLAEQRLVAERRLREGDRRQRLVGGIMCKQMLLPRLAMELPRSEEHTSELQSLMRISYAVFCLKKKKNKSTDNTTSNIIYS